MKLEGYQKKIVIIRIVLWAIPLVIGLWVFNQQLVPFGKSKIVYRVEESSPVIRNFASKEKDKLIGTGNMPGDKDFFQLITTTPLYFDVKVPRAFSEARVQVVYQNPDKQPVIRLGVLQKNGGYFFSDMSFQNPILENLPIFWSKIREGNLVLWQRDRTLEKQLEEKQALYNEVKSELNVVTGQKLEDNTGNDFANVETEQKYLEKLSQLELDLDQPGTPQPTYANIGDFFGDFMNIKNKAAQFHFSASSYVLLPGYVPTSQVTEINKSLRGKHELFVYTQKGEELQFDFTIRDANRHAGEDAVNVKILDNLGVNVLEKKLADDGTTLPTNRTSVDRVVSMLYPNTLGGMYRIVLDAPDDIFITKISSRQSKIVFRNSIYLAENGEYSEILGRDTFTPTSIYTNSTEARVRTSHPGSFQTLKVGASDIKLNVLHELVNLPIKKSAEVVTVVSPKNDIYFEGNGYFAFSKEQFFDPDYASAVTVDSVADLDGIDFIVANYPEPVVENGWLVAEATVQAPYLYFDKGADTLLHVMVDFPQLPEKNRNMKIKEIRIEFTKPAFTIDALVSKIKRWLSFGA